MFPFVRKRTLRFTSSFNYMTMVISNVKSKFAENGLFRKYDDGSLG